MEAEQPAVIVNVADMIDLAIGSPEVGIVDFNMLHAVLHCLAQQLRVLGKNVELRGSIASLPQTLRDTGQTLSVKEYKYDTEEATVNDSERDEEQKSSKLDEKKKDRKTSPVKQKKQKEGKQGSERKTGRKSLEGKQESDRKTGRRSSEGKPPPPEEIEGEPSEGKSAAEDYKYEYEERISSDEEAERKEKRGDEKQGGRESSDENQADSKHEDRKLSDKDLAVYEQESDESQAEDEKAEGQKDERKRKGQKDGKKHEGQKDGRKHEGQKDERKHEGQKDEIKQEGQKDERKHGKKEPTKTVGSKIDTRASTLLRLKEELVTPVQQDTVLVVERIKRGESPTRSGSPRKTISVSQQVPQQQPLSQQQTRRGSKDKLTLVTLSKFGILEDRVNDLRNRVYGSMPKNQEILEGVRSQTNLQAITDMWTSLNVSSRLEAAEIGLGKLSSLVQDLITEAGEVASHSSHTKPKTSRSPPTGAQTQPVIPSRTPLPEGPIISEAVVNAIEKLDNETKSLIEGMEELSAKVNLLMNPDTIITREGSDTTPVVVDIKSVMVRLDELERRIQVCHEDKIKFEGIIQDQISSFQDQLDVIHHEVKTVSGNNMGGNLSPDLVKDLQGLMELFQTVQEMQGQMNQLNRTASQLAEEREERAYHMDALVEQIEILKNIKLDKEDMAEAMADKVDTTDLARKVSRDRFDAACDDLARQLETALGKLSNQEALWQQALDDIQREIESKLDKMELSPVKEFFNKKLQKLQEYLKQMASLRREAEAAGTKKKLLREVNCISCDAPAVMPMEASMVPIAKPLQPSMSMKPYLSYELDTIRKQQASNVPQRNMHDWEQIGRQMMQPKRRTRSATNKHICNRYCGGSHTVTTPAQRVARLGHFIKQWGPDVLPLSSGFAAGDDGKFYKVSADAERVAAQAQVQAEEVCSPKSTAKHEGQKPAKTPGFGNAECRCLEKHL